MARAPGNLLSKEDMVRQARWIGAIKIAREQCDAMTWEYQPRIVKGEVVAAHITCEGAEPFEIPANAMDALATFVLGVDELVCRGSAPDLTLASSHD